MRKILVLLAVTVLAAGLFSPAEAARKKSYSISLTPQPGGTQPTYNDTSLDLSSSKAPVNTFTTIRGRLKGGSVAGKKVRIYATNMNSQARTRTSLGSAKVSRKGVFTKRFAPSKGQGGTYKIEVVKAAGAGRTAKVKTFYIRTFEFVSLARFHDASASTPGLVSRSDRERVGTAKNEYWSESYALQGPGTAVYDIRGYRCFYFNLKIGISYDSSRTGGSYSVTQPVRGTLMSGTKTVGGGFDEPGKSAGKSVRADQVLAVNVAGEQTTRFVLGNPKISCTIPTRIAAAAF